MGANSVSVAKPYGKNSKFLNLKQKNFLVLYNDLTILLESLLEPLIPGGPVWMTREEYILFGTHLLASNEPTEMEG